MSKLISNFLQIKMGIPRPKSKWILRKKQSHIIACYIYFFDSDYIGSSWFLKMVYIIRIYKKVIFISHLRRRPLFAPNFRASVTVVVAAAATSTTLSVLNIFILRERKSLVFDTVRFHANHKMVLWRQLPQPYW